LSENVRPISSQSDRLKQVSRKPSTFFRYEELWLLLLLLLLLFILDIYIILYGVAD